MLFAGLLAIAGRPVMLPVVSQVQPGSGAALAGVQPGDRIEAMNGKSIATFGDLQEFVTPHADQPVQVTILRDGRQIVLPVIIGSRIADGQRVGLLGIEGGDVEYKHVSLPAAIAGGFTETWRVTADTARGVAQIFTAGRGAGDIGGPLRIAQLSGQVAALGLANLVSFIAILSVNLGLINLLPIPGIDGGHLFFLLCEGARGRPLSARIREYGLRAGLAVLGGLFVFATWNDLTHLGLFRWFTG